MSTGVDDEVTMNSHALDLGIIMIDGINILYAGGRTEDIGGSWRRGMEVAEVEKEGGDG